VGAKSAPAGKVELPDSSDCSNSGSDHDTSISSNASETNLNDESLVHDINNIVKEQQKNLSRVKNSDQKLGIVSPGSQRWNLQRKDSMHSLASEPARSDQTTPFQRGAKSHSSLHRFRIKESKKSSHQDRHSSSVDRSLSPRLEGKSFYDGGSRGTPPSMAIQAGIKPHSARELQYNNKKKKKGMMEKIWSKFNKKKEGEERVGTPVGHWTMNRSFSPTKSDSESNKLDSLQNLKSTPGRKSIG